MSPGLLVLASLIICALAVPFIVWAHWPRHDEEG